MLKQRERGETHAAGTAISRRLLPPQPAAERRPRLAAVSEMDVEMAVLDIGRAVDCLMAAAQDEEGRGYIEANRVWLVEEMNRLSDILAGAGPQDSRNAARRRLAGHVQDAARRMSAAGSRPASEPERFAVPHD